MENEPISFSENMAVKTEKIELHPEQQTIVVQVAEQLHQDPQAVLDGVIDELEERAILAQSEQEIDKGKGISQNDMEAFFQELIDVATRRIQTTA